MSDCLSFIYDLLGDLFNFVLPWGITFGSIVCAVVGIPILVRAFKKLMG